MTSPPYHSLGQWDQIRTAKHAYQGFWFLGPSEKWPRWTLTACFSTRVFDDGRCILNCPSWKFEFKKQCHPCHHSCQGCQGSGPSNCTSCGVGEAIAAGSSLRWVCSLTSQPLVWRRSLVREPEVQSRQLFITALEQPEGSVAFRTHKLHSHDSTVDSLPLRR